MKSFIRWLSLLGYGLFTSTLYGAHTNPQLMRRRFEKWSSQSRTSIQRKYTNVKFEDVFLEKSQLKIETVCAQEDFTSVILYLHGGGFVIGSADSYRNRMMRLSYHTKAKIVFVEYRRSPEHRFPAAQDDAFAAWQWVLQQYGNYPLLISGDSAGGGLTLSLLLRLKDSGETLPQGVIMISPWTDHSCAGKSVETNLGKDLWFTKNHLQQWATYYSREDERKLPYVSPVFGEFQELPPMLLLAGENELLLDDATRVYEGAKAAGVSAELHIGKGMQHDWPLTLPWLDESKLAWKFIREFVVKLAN
ncbi:alpha/beta hydrolase [Reichenbachiella sp.]|uniref:alpha/beta hydrolase n=1 Tax=Reichenbachiella sp. TaxID=2184521 RepID=UPI003B5C31C5